MKYVGVPSLSQDVTRLHMQLPDPALTSLSFLKPSCDPWASNKEAGMSAVLVRKCSG